MESSSAGRIIGLGMREMHEKEITCQETLETDLPFYGRSPSFAFLRDRAFPHSRNIFLLFRWKKKMRKIEVKVNFTNFYNTFSIATYVYVYVYVYL